MKRQKLNGYRMADVNSAYNQGRHKHNWLKSKRTMPSEGASAMHGVRLLGCQTETHLYRDPCFTHRNQNHLSKNNLILFLLLFVCFAVVCFICFLCFVLCCCFVVVSFLGGGRRGGGGGGGVPVICSSF